MKAIEFPEMTDKIAELQEEYETLPAHINKTEGIVTCCFELTDEEVDNIILHKKIWHSQATNLQPMQPILLSTTKPELAEQEPPKPKSKIIT